MKKYACVGTHGAGKSTLCYLLASELKKRGENVYVLQEKVRNSPFPINDDMKAETGIWACTSQIAEELNADAKRFNVLVADRSPFDPFPYLDYFNLDHDVLDDLCVVAFQWLLSYRKIFWVRPDSKVIPDGVRSVDENFRKKIDERFAEFFERHPEIKKEEIWTSQIFSPTSGWVGTLL